MTAQQAGEPIDPRRWNALVDLLHEAYKVLHQTSWMIPAGEPNVARVELADER